MFRGRSLLTLFNPSIDYLPVLGRLMAERSDSGSGELHRAENG